MDGMSESDNASMSENGIVTVADYISRAESQSRQMTTKDPKKNKDVGQVDAIAEHSPQPTPTATNGSTNNNAAADNEDSNAAKSSTETPATDSHTGDSNPQPVVNGLS